MVQGKEAESEIKKGEKTGWRGQKTVVGGKRRGRKIRPIEFPEPRTALVREDNEDKVQV